MRVNSSGTSAAHLGDGDGCRGYRPGALRVHPLMEGCAVGLGGGYSLQGVSSGSSWPSRQRPHIWSSWLGCHCVEPHWSSGSTAGTGGGVPPPAGTAVYFKLMLTPRSGSSINCEQFNQSVSSCLKIFE